MKLINVDEVKNSLLIELLGGVDGGTDASYLKTYEVIDRIEKIVNEWVDNQPTVKAIPIEWILKWACEFIDPNSEGYKMAMELVHDWRKENEKDF